RSQASSPRAETRRAEDVIGEPRASGAQSSWLLPSCSPPPLERVETDLEVPPPPDVAAPLLRVRTCVAVDGELGPDEDLEPLLAVLRTGTAELDGPGAPAPPLARVRVATAAPALDA